MINDLEQVHDMPLQDSKSVILETGPMDVQAPIPTEPVFDPKSFVNPIEDDTWVDVFSRWIPAATVTCTQTQATGQEIQKNTIIQILKTNPLTNAQLENYSIFGYSAAKVRVSWTCSQFARGALLLTALPSACIQDEYAQHYDSPYAMILTPSEPVGELMIPLNIPNRCLALDDPLGFLGGFYRLSVLSPFIDDSSVTTVSSVSLEIQIQDPWLAGHRPAPVPIVNSVLGALSLITLTTTVVGFQGRTDPESDRKSKTGSLSSFLDNVSSTSAKISSIPTPLSPIASAVSTGASIASSFAKIFGLDKPNVATPPHVTVSIPNRDMATGSGMFEAAPMTLSPVSTTATSTTMFGGIDDVASIKRITETPSFLAKFPIVASATAYAAIAVVPIAPTSLRYSTSGAVFRGSLTHAGFVASHFNQWRGSLRYNFRFFGSPYTKCKIAIGWSPTVAPGAFDKLQNTRRVIYDINGSASITVDVPYLQAYPYLNTRVKVNGTDPLPTVNGYLTVYVISPFVVQGNAAPSPLDCVITMCAGPDFQLAGPCSPISARFAPAIAKHVLQGSAVQGIVSDDDVRSLLDIGHRYSYAGQAVGTSASTTVKIDPAVTPELSYLLSKFCYWRGNLMYKLVPAFGGPTTFTPGAVQVSYRTSSVPSSQGVLLFTDQVQSSYVPLSLEYDHYMGMASSPACTDPGLPAYDRTILIVGLFTAASTNAYHQVYTAWGDRFAVSTMLASPTLVIDTTQPL